MMRAMGLEPGPHEVARLYCDVASTFVLDARDAALRQGIEGLGYRVVVADTVMRDGGRTLVRAILEARAS
jgi:hypothetical protein